MTLVLGDYIDFISGPAFKSDKFTDSVEDVPLVKGDNLAQGYIKWEQSKYWPAQDVEAYTKYYLCPGDIVLAMDRPWVTAGLKFARIKESDPLSLVVQRIARLRAINGMSQDFLHALIGSKNFEEYIRNIMGGTNVPHISPAQIRAYEFDADKSSFAKVGSIYKSYTDLIENNRRRIQLLEESARLLYQEWFVHLRFPGHEQVKITDGEPEGWSETDLGKLFSIRHGYAFKGEYFSDEETNNILLTPGNFKVGGGLKLDKKKFYKEDGPIPEDYVLSENDLLITMTDLSKMSDTLGYPMLVPKFDGTKFLHNQRLGLVIPTIENFPKYFVYHLLQDYRYRAFVVGSATGTSVKHTAPKKITSFKFVIPDVSSNLVTVFNEYNENIYKQISTLTVQNHKLAQTRDLLLPKLMSGELTV